MRSKLNVHQLVNLVYDVAAHLIYEVLHGLLSFEKFPFEGHVNFLSCAKYRINRVVAGRPS